MDRPPNLDSCWLRRQNHLDLLLLRGSAASILTVVCWLQQHWDQEKSDANDHLILVYSQQESMQKGMHAKTGLTVHMERLVSGRLQLRRTVHAGVPQQKRKKAHR